MTDTRVQMVNAMKAAPSWVAETRFIDYKYAGKVESRSDFASRLAEQPEDVSVREALAALTEIRTDDKQK